jgi:hypothetical protein
MVNVHIHQFQAGGALVDARARQLFVDPTDFFRVFRYAP